MFLTFKLYMQAFLTRLMRNGDSSFGYCNIPADKRELDRKKDWETDKIQKRIRDLGQFFYYIPSLVFSAAIAIDLVAEALSVSRKFLKGFRSIVPPRSKRYI